MKVIKQGYYVGERPLFGERGLTVEDSVFTDGESPLKECRDIKLFGCTFKWKYPLWYGESISAENCVWLETARAGVWYTDNVSAVDCRIEAPKNFRRCTGVRLKNVSMPNAAETLWSCRDVTMENVTAAWIISW